MGRTVPLHRLSTQHSESIFTPWFVATALASRAFTETWTATASSPPPPRLLANLSAGCPGLAATREPARDTLGLGRRQQPGQANE